MSARFVVFARAVSRLRFASTGERIAVAVNLSAPRAEQLSPVAGVELGIAARASASRTARICW